MLLSMLGVRFPVVGPGSLGTTDPHTAAVSRAYSGRRGELSGVDRLPRRPEVPIQPVQSLSDPVGSRNKM